MSPGGSGMKGQYARTVNLFIQRICGGTLYSSFGTFPELWITLPPGAGTFTRLTDLELLPGPHMEDYRVYRLELYPVNFTLQMNFVGSLGSELSLLTFLGPELRQLQSK